MTEVMAGQPSLGLSAPSSRQDVISALLNDYGSSFGRGDESPYAYSPVPALKELPPPPPGSNEKPLPSVMMRFQLRVDETDLQDGQRKDSVESPTKIVSRSMSRSSKPPSLKLLASNGATAIVPPMPAPPPKDEPAPVPVDPFEDRPLPPPPPEKSERRMSQRRVQPAMGNFPSRPERRDSKEPQESGSMMNKQEQEQPQPAPAMRRKPVPVPSVQKKFPSLADLQKGPRGRSVAPKPTTATAETVAVPRESSQESSRRPSVPSIREQSRNPSSTRGSRESSRRPSLPGSQERTRKPSIPSSVDEAPARNALSGHRPTFSKSSTSSPLPPTPVEKPTPVEQPSEPKVEAPLPPPPRKVFAGLPSNPRSKAPEPTKHSRGKSSTGFDIMKNTTKPAPVQTTNLNTITPGPTPSPNKTEEAQKSQGQSMANSVQAALRRPQSPISPVSDYDGRRPFSFEAVQQAQKQQPQQQQRPAQQRPISPVSPPDAATRFPPRTTSRPDTQPDTQQNPFQDPAQPAVRERSDTPTEEPPFIPLTVSPIPTVTPQITEKELNCYTHHATFARFYAKHQPMSCMVCRQDTDPRKVSCHWCYLRVCFGCQDELSRIPGRDLRVLMEQKGMKINERQEEGMPSVVVWEAEGEGDDFS